MGMGFEAALVLLKDGKKVTRNAWKKGKDILPDTWIMLVESSAIPYRGVGRIHTLPWIGMRISNGGFLPWTLNQEDVLAHDWIEVE